MHGFHWFKAQNNHNNEIYNISIRNLRKERINFVTSWSATLDFDGFKPCNAPIFFYNACMIDWMQNWSLTMHESSKISIHHCCIKAPSMNKHALFSSILHANLLKNSSGPRIKQWNGLNVKNFQEKKWEKICVF